MTADAHPNEKTMGPDETLRKWGSGFLERLFAVVHEVLDPEEDEFGDSWLAYEFWTPFRLDPGDVPTFLWVLRQAEPAQVRRSLAPHPGCPFPGPLPQPVRP